MSNNEFYRTLDAGVEPSNTGAAMETNRLDHVINETTGKLAEHMKVEQLFVQRDPGRQNMDRFNDILEAASVLRDTWKRRVEAFTLGPDDEMKFYRRQFNGLFDVLSVSLFGGDDASHEIRMAPAQQQAQPQTTPPPQPTSADSQACETSDGGKELKRKRTTTANDFEYIFFQKNGKYVYRRLESAEKYAKRGKIDRYISISPKEHQFKSHVKTFATKLRQHESKLLSGNEILFDGDHQELYDLLCRLVSEISLDHFVNVHYIRSPRSDVETVLQNATLEADECGGGETEGGALMETQSSPPKKKAKKKEHKKRATEKKQRAPVDEITRTYVEENTQPEDVAIDRESDPYSDFAVESILKGIVSGNEDESVEFTHDVFN